MTHTIRISQISLALIAIARKLQTEHRLHHFVSTAHSQQWILRVHRCKDCRPTISKIRLKKINRAPKIEPNEGSSARRARARASKRQQHEWLPSFIFGPVLPPPPPWFCPGLHGARTLRKRNGPRAEDEEGGQEAPETSERMQPVPPRSVFLPWRRSFRVAPTDILLPTRGLHVPPFAGQSCEQRGKGPSGNTAPLALL